MKLRLNLMGIYPNLYFSFLMIICPTNKQVVSMYCDPIIAHATITENVENI